MADWVFKFGYHEKTARRAAVANEATPTPVDSKALFLLFYLVSWLSCSM